MEVSKKVAKVVLPLGAGFMATAFYALFLGLMTSFGIFAYQVYAYLVHGVWEWLTVADLTNPGSPIVSLMGTWPAIVSVLVVFGIIYAAGLGISDALERLLPDDEIASSTLTNMLFIAVPIAALLGLGLAFRYFLSGE